MTALDRLICAGLSPEEATDVIAWYRMQGDENALEKYIREVENYVAAV